MSAPCPHGMPSPASCLTCMEDDGLGAPVVPPVTVEFTFTSKFDGKCRKCGDETTAGDVIAKMSDDSYRCLDCAGVSR